MNRAVLICLVASCSIATILALAQTGQQVGQIATAQPAKVTIEGLVRDIACPIQNPKANATEFNLQCALECARHGSPLVIQTKDGELYIPISGSMPDQGQPEKLMPFVGKYVRARGAVFERKGTHAIVISEIKEMKDVHLTTDAKRTLRGLNVDSNPLLVNSIKESSQKDNQAKEQQSKDNEC